MAHDSSRHLLSILPMLILWEKPIYTMQKYGVFLSLFGSKLHVDVLLYTNFLKLTEWWPQPRLPRPV